MNKKLIFQILGKMLFAEGALMVLPILVSVWFGEEKSIFIFSAIAVLLILLSLPLIFLKVSDNTIYAKEGFVITILTWILLSVGGAIPFVVGGWIPNVIDALFETVSGFTTTGASILSEVETLPKGVLFWRTFTHWVGGMGVLFFVMAIVPVSKNHAMHIMRAELTGPNVGKVVPKGMRSAKILYGIYLGLTLAEALLLRLGGMSFYDSVMHAFSTAGTGGFSTKNASIAYFDSAYIDGVITVFMLLFSINFNMFYFLLVRKFASVRQNSEWKVFLGIVGGAIALVTIFILPEYHSVLKSFRYAAFQVASCISTTGFVTADFDAWCEPAKYILLFVMLVGGCAGATCGGMKVVRLQVLVKSLVNEVKRMVHPQTVNCVKLDDKPLEDSLVRGTLVYAVLLAVLFIISTMLVGLENQGFETTTTAVITCLSNVGPGLAKVGPTCNFSGLAPLSKIVLIVDMLLGRLEIFPVLLLFVPKVWRKRFM